MAAAVSCTACHDFTQRHSRQAVGAKCVACHDAAYLEFLREWTAGLDREAARAGEALKRADAALAAARRAGRQSPQAEALAREAREALALVRTVRGVHNPAGAQALLEAAQRKAEEAFAQAGRR
jgi:beta-phosphoglucomutase-like phosphatase (HAD superfamily)